MAEDCTDGDYLGAYSRFFTDFVAKINPYDQLPVSVNSYNVTDAEIVGEIINITLQYLNQAQCPSSLQAHLVHQVIQEIKSMCIKQPEDCGFKFQEKTYTSLKLMQAITGKVNEICFRYLDNSRLALLPPPPSSPLPQIVAGGYKNCKRRMEDRYAILHDLHTTFGIMDDTVANYYAVFDGHAGQDAAVYCATHLHQYLAESIYYPTDPEHALRDAFVTTDAQFIEKSKTQKLGGGTTAVCTLLANKKLYCSWVGDSIAMLIKRDSIVQLVNPHQLHREDEVQRIRKMGGVVMRNMGIMRVNGALSVSRAIGDIRYKPFVTSEPESRVYTLDGTEDFLIIATDGLSDFMKPAEIVTILYHEINRNPNGLKRAHQICLQWAKHAGSRDNITLVVVLLTPASEIAARPANAHPLYSAQVDDILEKMNSKEKPLFLDIDDAHNAINSNILKQAIITQETRDQDDDGILAASNGKHENGDAEYDYSDLGPETDVDAIDDVPMPVKNPSYEFYKDDESSHDGDHATRDSNILDNVNEKINDKRPDAENNVHEDEDDVLDEAPDVVQGVPQQVFGALSEDVRKQIEEAVNDEVEMKDVDRVDNAREVIGEPGPVDYDSPPSPQANKPLQHALIPEADNVADSEDSEDEWNYYRVDPNKEKDSATPVEDELQETKNERQVDSPELPVEDTESKIQSHDIEEEEEEEPEEEAEEEEEEKEKEKEKETEKEKEKEEEEIKCKSPIEQLSKLIDTEISVEDIALESKLEKLTLEENDEESRDMAFQLNPDAAEFIPVSPQFMGNRMGLIEDYPISGSPLKQVPEMDIEVPTQSEFEEEVCRRPREVESEDKQYSNGDHDQRNDAKDFASERQKSVNLFGNLDESEVSSTKAEFGDESTASFLTASEFHRTGISTIDESSFMSTDRDYDIAKDPMAMSFTPSDFEAAFDKGVDLNAVHDLTNADVYDKNGTLEEEEDDELGAQSPEPQRELVTDAERLVHTPTFDESVELVNLSAQHEDNETTFIEHVSDVKTVTDFLSLQTESFQVDKQESTKSDHSPLTDNYSAECESEKEAVSVDNEQPLSPSSIDVDETKPIDETSEDAVLLGSELQKEVSVKEIDTPLSLSPVPDAMEHESDEPPTKDAEPPTAEIETGLQPEVPEFKSEPFNFHSFGMESGDVCKSSPIETTGDQFSPMEIDDDSKSPMEARDASQSPTIEMDDVCQLPSTKTDDVYRMNSMNIASEHELLEQNLNEDAQIVDQKIVENLQDKLLDFGEEEEQEVLVCMRSEIPADPTPPPTSQKFEVADNYDDLLCPITSARPEKQEEIIESMEMEQILETKVQTVEEPMSEAVLKLSDSMQEFTGLESQLQPTLEKTPEEAPVTSDALLDFQEEAPKQEELIQEVAEPEKLVEPTMEKELKFEEEKVEVVTTAVREEIPTIVETAPAEEKTVPPTIEEAPPAVEEAPKIEEASKESKATKTKGPEIKLTETVVAAAAVTAVGVAAVAAQGKAKAKTAAKPTKTTTSKTAQKSTPTSPSKTVTSTTKASTATAKKPQTSVAARPKDLDAPKKTTVASPTCNKAPNAKPASKTTAASSAATKLATKSTISSVAKPKPTSTAPKAAASDKKPTANGEVKSLSKPIAAKPPVSKVSSTTKSTLVKTSVTSTRTSIGTTATAKPRPASATATSKPSTTAKPSSAATTTAARPKTSPAVGSATKSRNLLTVKSPIIDKQVKETANKQISMARTSTTTKTSRLSNTATTTTTTKRLSTTTKITAAASPTKKPAATLKAAGKTSLGGKTTASEKGKVVQNGVSEKTNAIIDDMPKKDLSPVVTPNDNQLIMSSD